MRKGISASNAAQRMACPGSANLEAAIPGWTPPVLDPTKFKAKGIGTLLHEIMEPFAEMSEQFLLWLAVQVSKFAKLPIKKRRELTGDVSEMVLYLTPRFPPTITGKPSQFLVDWFMQLEPFAPKMLRYVADCARSIAEIKSSYTYQGDEEYYAELEMETTWLAEPGKTTADVVVWDRASRVLEIVDYKTGRVPVSAVDNDQLMFYARSAIRHLLLDDQVIHSIRLHIMQPDNFEEHAITRKELDEWTERALEAESKIIDGVLTLTPSDHCTFCPANPYARGERGYPVCPAQREFLFPSNVDLDEILA